MGGSGSLSTAYSNFVPLQIQLSLQWLLKMMLIKEEPARISRICYSPSWKWKSIHCKARRSVSSWDLRLWSLPHLWPLWRGFPPQAALIHSKRACSPAHSWPDQGWTPDCKGSCSRLTTSQWMTWHGASPSRRWRYRMAAGHPVFLILEGWLWAAREVSVVV